MIDWTHIIAGVFSAGVVLALARAYRMVKTTMHKSKSETVSGNRDERRRRIASELRVVYRSLKEQKADIAEYKKDRVIMADALSHIKSEHTACLMEQERLRRVEQAQLLTNKKLEARVQHLEKMIGSKAELNVNDPDSR